MLFVNVWGYCSLLGVGVCGICVVCVGSGYFSTRPEKIKKCRIRRVAIGAMTQEQINALVEGDAV